MTPTFGEEVAIGLARARAAKDQTHWQVYDAVPSGPSIVRAACGQTVRLEQLTAAPTCPRCQIKAAAYDALDVA